MGEETTRRVMELAEERADDACAPLQSFKQFVTDEVVGESPDRIAYQWEHSLNCLEQHSQISLEQGTASKVPMGGMIKKIVRKLVMSVTGVAMREQNSYNLEVANIIRDMQQEISLLEQKIKELQEKQ